MEYVLLVVRNWLCQVIWNLIVEGGHWHVRCTPDEPEGQDQYYWYVPRRAERKWLVIEAVQDNHYGFQELYVRGLKRWNDCLEQNDLYCAREAITNPWQWLIERAYIMLRKLPFVKQGEDGGCQW